MSIPWKSLKKVHDTLVGNADRFFAGGAKMPHVLFLVKVDTESGAITNCEMADSRIAAHILSDKERMVSRVRELLTEDAALGRDAMRSFGFLPNVVMQFSEVVYATDEDAGRTSPPPELHPNRRNGLFVCVHTATESYPALHPILDGPPRHCDVREFPAQSCELTVFMAKAAL
jgi:hypothetical protein